MASPRDSLISALANGSPIDWGTLEHPSWGGRGAAPAARGEGRLAVLAIPATRLVRVAWSAVLLIAGLQVAVTMSDVFTALTLPGASEPGWLLLSNVSLFGVFGALLVFGGRREPRLQALGAVFLMIGSAFAYPLLMRTASLNPGWFHGLLRTIPIDAFFAASLWLCVRAFPREPRDRMVRRVGTTFLTASAILGTMLVAANLAVGWGSFNAGTPGAALLSALDRHKPASAYWLLMFGAAAPAIPYLLWKARLETAEERRKVGLFLTALVVGVSPFVLAVLTSIFVPALGQPPLRDLIGVVLYAALASMVPTTAYALLVGRGLEIQLGVRRATQLACARYAVWLASIGPLTYLAADLYVHRDLTLASYLGQGEPIALFLLLSVGFSALTFRYQMLRGVDLWFRSERADYAESLARLDCDLRGARTIRDIAAALEQQIARAIRPGTVSVLVANETSDGFVPVVGSSAPIAADSVLLDLARSASVEVRVTLGLTSRIVPLLPPSDQAWLTDGGIHLVTPLVGSSGTLMGLVALGQGLDGLPYTERDYAVIASMCGQATLQLENQWLRERPSPDGGRVTPRDGVTTVNWQNEPAECCPRCSLVWPTGTRVCSCGESVKPAALPLLVKGKFRLERLLGAGGMGVVYLATDIMLGRKVALKTLPRVSDALAARLQQEAVAMATVRHPHLALIFGAEQWRETPVLIVEYLEGGTLLDWLRRGPLTVSETLSLGIVLSDVLDRLHGTGVLHRDVKPSNIGYTMDGVPKLLDLGLAAMLDGAEPDMTSHQALDHGSALLALDRRSVGTSNTGQLLGTLRYMSPEALAGESPRPSFDLWSLSFVLYESLAGRHPFADLSPEDVVTALRRSAIPDIRDVCPECPPNLAGFLHDSLSPVPARRPASAAALRGVLQALQTQTGRH